MAFSFDRSLNPNATEFVPSFSAMNLSERAVTSQVASEDATEFDSSGNGVLTLIQYAGYSTVDPSLLYEPIAFSSNRDACLSDKCQSLEKEAKSLSARFEPKRLLAIIEEFPWKAGSAYTVGTQTSFFRSIRCWLKLAYRNRYHVSSTLFDAIFEITRAVQLCRGFNEAQKFEARRVVGLIAQGENVTSLWRLWPWRAIKCRDGFDLNLLKIFARIHTVALTEPALSFNHAVPFAYAEGIRRATSNDLTMEDAGAMEMLNAHTMAKRVVFLELGDRVSFASFELATINDWFRIISEFKKDRLLYGPVAAGMQPWQLRPWAHENQTSTIPRRDLFPFHGTRGPASARDDQELHPLHQTMKKDKPPKPPTPARPVDGFLPPPPRRSESCLAGLPTWQPEGHSRNASVDGNVPSNEANGKTKVNPSDHMHSSIPDATDSTASQSEHLGQGEKEEDEALTSPNKDKESRVSDFDWWHERPIWKLIQASIEPPYEKPLAKAREKKYLHPYFTPASADQRGWGFIPQISPKTAKVANDRDASTENLQGVDPGGAATRQEQVINAINALGSIRSPSPAGDAPQKDGKQQSYAEIQETSRQILRDYLMGGEHEEIQETSRKILHDYVNGGEDVETVEGGTNASKKKKKKKKSSK